MNSRQSARKLLHRLITVGTVVLFLVSAAALNAQVTTQTTTTRGPTVHQVTVERGEVVFVSGNDLIVRRANGQLEHFAHVPESARVNVDGQQLGIHDLKPGMKLQRTTIVSTTPETVTTVTAVTGKVWHVNPPLSVILTLDDGTNQQFSIPKDQKFMINGALVDAWGLKKGMKVSATKVVEVPGTVVSQHRELTGAMPPPPPPPAADAVILIAEEQSAPAPATEEAATEEPAATQLPKTSTLLPLIGLLSLLSLGASLGMSKLRRSC
jgi:hypothetical protein